MCRIFVRSLACVCLAVLLAVLFLTASPASAQRKPEPAPWPPPEQPRESEVTPEFLDAYKAAGSPRLLVFTYLVTIDESRTAELNELGVAHQFNTRLEQMFTHPEISLRDLSFGEVKGKQSFTDGFMHRVQTDQLAGARWLANQSEAGVVVFVLLTEQAGRADGTAYSASYVLLDAQRGERFGSWSWDMRSDQTDGAFSAARLGEYAGALATRMYRDFELHFAPTRSGSAVRTFTLDVSGVPDDQLASVRELAKGIDGVQDVLRPQYETGHRMTRLRMDLRYTGDAFDLSNALRKQAADLLGMGVFVGEAREGRIVMRAYPKPAVTAETLLSGDDIPADRQAEADQLRKRFADAYTGKESPYVAVMINHEVLRPARAGDVPEPENPQAPADGSGAGTSIVVSPQVFVDSAVVQDSGNITVQGGAASARPKRADLYTDEELLNTRAMENGMFERLGKLKVRRKELQQAWRMLAEEQKLTDKSWDERELARMLGQKAGADIIVSGAGRVLRNPADGYIELFYTLRVYTVADAEVLAASTVHTLIDADALDLRAATDALAAEAVGKVAYQMLQSWE